MFYCVYIGNSKVSNTARDVLSLGEKMFLLNKIVCKLHIYMYLTIKNFHSIFLWPFSFYLELLFLLNFLFLRRKFQQTVATPLFLFFFSNSNS